MLWVRVELLDYMVTVKNKKERKTMFVYEIRRQRNNVEKDIMLCGKRSINIRIWKIWLQYAKE